MRSSTNRGLASRPAGVAARSRRTRPTPAAALPTALLMRPEPEQCTRVFLRLLDTLDPLLDGLLACPPIAGDERLPLHAPRCAVYLFSTGSEHLYVGRTNRLGSRYKEHRRGRHNDAPFAFKLARHATGNLKKQGGLTREALQENPEFAAAFVDAKQQITLIDFRWVEEQDPNTQCLLEIYATIALYARYNDFMNH